MIDWVSTELSISEGVVWAFFVLTAVSLVLQVWALIDLSRRKKVLWNRKWIWVLIILLVNNAFGVLLWAVLGRRVPQGDVLDASRDDDGPSASRTQAAVDALYGMKDG